RPGRVVAAGGPLQRTAGGTPASRGAAREDRDALHRRLRTMLSHVDERGEPTMVDVSGKVVTKRTAVAEARVRFPPDVARSLQQSGYATAKGPVFHTAIVAGVMAAKRTHELIPFCHP